MSIEQMKKIAIYTREIIDKLSINKNKENPEIYRYFDKKENNFIRVFQIKDIIEKGINIFGTIGVSEYDISLKTDNLPLRVEFIALSNKSFSKSLNIESKIPNILSTCAFCIKNSNYKCYPGAIFLDVIEPFYPNTDMKHILFTNLLPYMNELKALYLEDKIVSWLLAVPISEKEYLYSVDYGIEALETLLEKKQVDIANLDRKSII